MQPKIIIDEWKIIVQEFEQKHHEQYESIFSIGNGKMGQRANFEETYTGKSLQGSYIAGVYFPDKTRVGWWKNGYPEYFAKVLNSPNWIGLKIFINDEEFDLAKCNVFNYSQELNMKNGLLTRKFNAKLKNNSEILVETLRFLSMTHDEIGAIKYSITPLNNNVSLKITSFIDTNVRNKDSNYNEEFWEAVSNKENLITVKTKKLDFFVSYKMDNQILLNEKKTNIKSIKSNNNRYVDETFLFENLKQNEKFTIEKMVSVVSSLNYDKNKIEDGTSNSLKNALEIGFENLLNLHKKEWENKWEKSDIKIEGDTKAQQAIRFNIFQLNQTYTGKDSRLNIGPKGFTGEKYGGSTYWDTEAYCIPFYLSSAKEEVSRQLLEYRFNQLPKAIENGQKLGFTNGAALYPMVTMNGEECHNEWEITFEEIHRNGAIAYAIYQYTRYTGDTSYIQNHGIEVLIAISRFWAQRFHFSNKKNKYVMMGVTGPNEYENNVDNNWYTNYIARWVLNYTTEQINLIKENRTNWEKIKTKTKFEENELSSWKKISENIFFPECKERNIFLQQENFLDKELIPVSKLDPKERPINQHWSWDRILRSVYIKQADVLQGLYFFEDDFDKETIRRNYEFYDQFTVHESSLSPCIYSILAAKLDKIDEAYNLYLRTSRLDLDDYNKEVHEGLHITSMAGTWMSIVYGFCGLKIKENKLTFTPKLPKNWKRISFKIYFRGKIEELVFENSK